VCSEQKETKVRTSNITTAEACRVFGQAPKLTLVEVFRVVTEDEHTTGFGGLIEMQRHVETTQHRRI
jgi:hypothetical protein